MQISAVIPTRNRAHSIRRLCESLRQQTLKLAEVIIVDASDDKRYQAVLKDDFPEMPLHWINSEPSVCIQRNTGIALAKSEWIFLCDDDITLPADYLEKLAAYINVNPACGAIAGRLQQLEGDVWQDQYPVKGALDLFYRFVFQHSIWGDLGRLQCSKLVTPLVKLIQRWYVKRGNTYSRAGWPLITNWSGSYYTTKFYSLGANIVRKTWLLNAPYDEVLDPSGIGDNYGVAFHFPGVEPIHVVASTFAQHHRATENRLTSRAAYYRRILALHYFWQSEKKTSVTAWLVWSLLGKLLHQLLAGNFRMAIATVKAVVVIITATNPYWKGHIKGIRIVKPEI